MNEIYSAQTNITALKDQVDSLISEGRAIVIADNASYEFAGEFLRKIKQAQKQVDETRKGMTRPMDEAKKKVMELFKPVESRILEVEASIKTSLLSYQRVQEEKLQKEMDEKRRKDAEEMAQKQKDAAFFGHDIEMDMPNPEDAPKTILPSVSGIATKTVWAYEIVNENLLPRNMFSVDEKKIKAAIDLGLRDVPGLRIYQKQIISARG